MSKVNHNVARLCEHRSHVCDIGADGAQALAVLSAAAPVRTLQRRSRRRSRKEGRMREEGAEWGGFTGGGGVGGVGGGGRARK